MSIVVNSIEIPSRYVERLTRQQQPIYEEACRQRGVKPDFKSYTEGMNKLFREHELLRQESVRRFGEPDAKRVAAFLNEYRAHIDAGFADLSPAEQEEEARHELAYRIFRRALKNETPAPTPAEIRAYYDAHLADFAEPEHLIISRITQGVSPDCGDLPEIFQRLSTLRGELLANAISWPQAVQEFAYYNEQDQAPAGTPIVVYRHSLPAEIEDKLFALPEGSYSEVFDINELVNLCKILRHVPAATLPFKEIEPELHKDLFEEAFNQHVKEIVDALSAQAK